MLRGKYHIFNRLSNLWDNYYNNTFEWYISCMAILRGVIYSQSVTVILEYVDLLVEYICGKDMPFLVSYVLLILA